MDSELVERRFVYTSLRVTHWMHGNDKQECAAVSKRRVRDGKMGFHFKKGKSEQKGCYSGARDRWCYIKIP